MNNKNHKMNLKLAKLLKLDYWVDHKNRIWIKSGKNKWGQLFTACSNWNVIYDIAQSIGNASVSEDDCFLVASITREGVGTVVAKSDSYQKSLVMCCIEWLENEKLLHEVE